MAKKVEMEMTKEKKEFTSLSDSIVKLITQKHEEIEAKAKQLLVLKAEEFERMNKEVVERSTMLESEKVKLALREKQYEERLRELEIHAVEIDEDRYRVAEQLRELELKDLGFKRREEEIELRSRDMEGQRKELDRILEKFEADKKKLEKRIHEIDRKEKQMEGRIRGLDILSKDLERQSRELDSERKKSDERMHKLDQKERQLDERVKVFESSKKRLDEDWKKLDFRVREVSCKERELDRGLEQLKLKEDSLDMKSKEIEMKRNKSDNLCKEYSPANLRQMIGSLSKHDKEEHKEAAFHAPGSSVPVSSIEPKAVVSTEGNISDHDAKFKRRKLLDGKSISTDNPEPEKQVCGSEKDLGALLGQNLDFCSMRTEVVGILRSSANPARLVLDAMRLCFLHICGGASEEILMKWCISLLKELRGYTIEHCYCEEARMLGISWKKILEEEKSCDAMEIACFLLFHDVYQMLFAIRPAKVVSLINSLDCPKQLHEVFEQIGCPEFLPDMIKRWIGANHRLQAIRSIHALQLGARFPLVQLINEHLDDYWNKLAVADERYKGPNSSNSLTMHEINHRLQGLNGVFALVRDCKLESVYPIKKLEDSRNELIRRKERTRKASTANNSKKKQKRKRACEEQLGSTSQVGISSSEPPVPHFAHLQGVGLYQPAPLPPNHFNNQQQCGSYYAGAPRLFPNQGFIR